MARKKKAKTSAEADKIPDFTNRPLSGLAGLASKEPKAVKPPRRPARSVEKQPTGDKAEDVDFAKAMAGVVPLVDRDNRLPPPPKLPTTPSPVDEEEREVLQTLWDLVEGDEPFSIHHTDESIEGIADGVDRRLLRRLKRGEFSVQDHLDLHGFSRKEARPLVHGFISKAITEGKRCVLIIHGRGHGSKDKIPVLKLALKSWLARSGIRKHILAFSTAQPFDGGGGAIYVLLRRIRRQG